MSDNMMSVDRARRLTDGGRHTTHAGLVIPAARTIVAQAEQIETLSRLLSGAEEAAIERAEQIKRLQRAVNYAVINSIQDAFDLVVDGVLHPEDMEAPE